MATALLLGSTGMVGTQILSTLRNASPHLSNIATITRRAPPDDSSASVPLNPFINTDTSTWPTHLQALAPPPSIVFSSLATTRAAAGSFAAQYTLEHDMNVTLARTAKERGAKVYVLISGAGANPNAFFAYPKMKGEIEEHIKELGFEHMVIVRPGLIAGQREESRLAEGVFRKIAAAAGSVSNGLKDFWAQDCDVIAKAAVSAGFKALKGELDGKVTILSQADIVRLGRTEWKGF